MQEPIEPGGSDPAPAATHADRLPPDGKSIIAARAVAAPATVNRAARTVEVVWSTGARARNFVIAAFVSGLVISLLELACTGQVYAPIIYQIQHGRLDASDGTASLCLLDPLIRAGCRDIEVVPLDADRTPIRRQRLPHPAVDFSDPG